MNVWSLDAANPGSQLPLQTRCDSDSERCSSRHGQSSIHCTDLGDDDKRTLIDPDIVRDVVIGLSDGLTVPFALTAGLSSLGESRLVILGGIAELIAGAISMGIGGFLASQAERDHYQFLKRRISARVQRSCDDEIEREVYAILGPAGIDKHVAQAVTNCLRPVESERSESTADEEQQQLTWKDDTRLTTFLLKFGEGLKEIPTERPYLSAITIGLGYLVGGIIPLVPYFFVSRAHVALLYSCIFTGVVLLVFGAVKARVTGAGNNVAGYMWGAVSTLMVGGAAAIAAYGIVALFERKP